MSLSQIPNSFLLELLLKGKKMFPEGNLLYPLTLLHSEWPKLRSFGHSECNRVKSTPIWEIIVNVALYQSGDKTTHVRQLSPL